MRLPQFVSNASRGLVQAVLIVAGVAVASAAAAQTVGTITLLQGTATITRGGATTPATLSMPVQLHDRVNTGGNSYLTISMLGGSAMTLSSDSTLTIDESQNIGGTDAPTKVGLLGGRLHTLIVGAMRTGAPNAFEVHTPNAVGAVRGTEWDEDYEEGTPKSQKYPDCRQITEVWVEDGVVHVTNPATPNDPGKDVGKGQYVIVPCGYIPGADAAAATAGGLAGPLTALGIVGVGTGIAAGVIAAHSPGGGSGPPPSSSK